MPVGFNVCFEIWNISQGSDDDIGGAVVTGSHPQPNVWGSFAENAPSELLLQQGIEVKTTATALLRASLASATATGVNVQEGDELKISAPANHEHYGHKFRVISVQRMPTHPSQRRNILKLTLRRIDQSRHEDWV